MSQGMFTRAKGPGVQAVRPPVGSANDQRLGARRDHNAATPSVSVSPLTQIPRRAGGVKLRPSQVPVRPTATVDAVVSGLTVQCCRELSSPGDALEREACTAADTVIGMDRPLPTGLGAADRPCPGCADGTQTPIQRSTYQIKSDVSEQGLDTAIRVAGASGTPLPNEVRAYFEPRFGHDFSRVRVHADSASASGTQAVRARAYTVGEDIVFGANEYSPATADGRRLLAHELAHAIQQGAAAPAAAPRARGPEGPSAIETGVPSGARAVPSRAAPHIARQADSASAGSTVGYVAIYLDSEGGGARASIELHTSTGIYRYQLEDLGDLEPGESQATVEVHGNDVLFTLDVRAGQLFKFRYRVDPGQPNPATFFRRQPTVIFSVSADEPPQRQPPEEEAKDDRDPSVVQLTPEEAMRRCASGNLPGVKVFPFRGTRFGGAPLTVFRDGDDIVVKSYVYVLGNTDFAEQTRTLPKETFIGGVRLKRNEIVRVHTYEPRWYHLNITGSTAGDIENEFCVTGEGMLKIGEMSDLAVKLNIGLTVIDAATLIIPVGKLATIIGTPVLRGGRVLAASVLLGLRDAAPTAFAGIASQSARVLIEEQVVDQVSSRALSETASHTLIEFSEHALEPAASSATGSAAGGATAGGVREAVARTVTVTSVDAAGHQVISSVTTPTGDKALDQAFDEAWNQTLDTSTPATPGAPGQGTVSVPPEVAAGFTPAHVIAFRRILGNAFDADDIKILEQLWDAAARPGDAAILAANNSRYLFDLQRNRFWLRVASNPQASALFTDAGCQFSGGAPYYMLNGRRITITIDHIIERQTAPQLALTASNLQLSFSRENSVVLRLLNQLDPFQ